MDAHVDLYFSTHITISVTNIESEAEARNKAIKELENMWNPIRGLPKNRLDELLDNALRWNDADNVRKA